MRLSTKLLLFITGSKVAIAVLFVLLLPFLAKLISSNYTNQILKEQKQRVLQNIKKNSINYYLQGDSTYGSYTMLKEEYISLEQAPKNTTINTIKTTQRIVEQDTLNYRILSYTFKSDNKNYLLEIGKTTSSIDQYYEPLQRFALYMLIALISISIVIDLTFTKKLISPLGKIIKTKLKDTKFPFDSIAPKVKTGTVDFAYLDRSLIQLMRQINTAFYKEREFTANASHEFMTPISILQNKMENLIADENTSEEVQLAVVDMMRTLDRLKKISRSLLLISRIESEQYFKSETASPKELIFSVADELGYKLQQKQIIFDNTLQQDVQLKNINHDLLYQLFCNLIDNAIKFTPDNGRISVTEKLSGDMYQITITDSGTGIEKEQLPHVFDRFKKNTSAKNMGYGLGLAIVKSIADYLIIKIEIQSKINVGTSVILGFRL